MAKSFFNEAKEQSQVKTAIVTKYFDAWWRIVLPRVAKSHGRVGYLDLFAGPGRFLDGTISTPLLILQNAIAEPKLAASLVTMFNDASKESSSNLRKEVRPVRLESGGSFKSQGKLTLREPFFYTIVQYNTCQCA